MYVRLKARQHLDIEGIQKTYQRGDWVDIGKQLAIKLIAEGAAELATNAKIDLGALDCGAIVYGNIQEATKAIRRVGLDLEPSHSTSTLWEFGPPLASDRTLLWTGPSPLRLDIIPVGFSLLDRWEVVCPLWSYDQLARDLAQSDEEGVALEEEILDTRVPAYDTRAIFIRRTPTTEKLLEVWKDIMGGALGMDNRLAFLAAVWRTKPLILAVPPTWHTDRDVDTTSQTAA